MVYRVWDYTPYILRVSIFTEPRKEKADIKDPRRTVILLMLNYLEMIFWFAALYSTFDLNGWLHVKEGTRPLATFRESTMLMVANWSGNLEDLSRSAWFAVTFQSLFGLLMTLMIVSRFIAFLPSPTGSSATELETEIIRDTEAQVEKPKKTKPKSSRR